MLMLQVQNPFENRYLKELMARLRVLIKIRLLRCVIHKRLWLQRDGSDLCRVGQFRKVERGGSMRRD